jgi:FkbM family methyltransferase
MAEGRILNVQGGARIAVPAALGCLTTYVLLEQEDWFEDEIRFVRRWLQPGMQAVDVGANIGVYTVAMARAVGSGGRVWAFEPTPASADLLQRNLALNEIGNVDVIRAAASDREGPIELSVGIDAEANTIVKPGEAGGERIPATAVTLDAIAAGRGWAGIDLIKLDVEGHEFEAICGAARFLAANSPLVMFEIKAGAAFDLRALEPLARLGYEFYRLLPGPLCLVPFDRRRPADSDQINLFACKPDRMRQLAAEGWLAAPDLARAVKPSASAWLDFSRSAPYSRAQASRWSSGAGGASDGGAAAQREGLAAFAESRDPARDLAERLEMLWHALGCVARALKAEDTLARRLSLARLTWETGMRSAAIVSLGKAAGRVKAEGALAGVEPFLAPSPRYEQIPDEMPAGEWLETAVIEQFEKLRTFSSFFGGTSSLAVLEPLIGRAYCSAEMERRRQLVRMRAGLQSHTEPSPLLCRGSAENLNPEFWCAQPQ